MPPDKPKVFVSYARADGEGFATRLRERLERDHSDIPLWQDRVRMIGGVGWWKQIEEAIVASEVLVIVITPAALDSDMTRKEWRYARQEGVFVCPVKGVPDDDLDFSAMPQWMRKAHFYDLDAEWGAFVDCLKNPPRSVRAPFMAPDVPDRFVQRPDEFDRLMGHLLKADREEPIAITTALHGAGGFGKTTLAVALCHHDDVITAFDDGILWVTLGETPNLLGELTKLHAALTGERPGFVDVQDAARNLAQKLEDRNCLLVIDDAWEASHLRPFLRGAKGCARLITTRNFDLVIESGADATRVNVDEMRAPEAVELLLKQIDRAAVGQVGNLPESAGMPISEEDSEAGRASSPCSIGRMPMPRQAMPQLEALARRLGEWPLLLGLAGAALRRRIARGDSIDGALEYFNRAFDRYGPTAADKRRPKERHEAVSRTIEVSLDMLDTDERVRCIELAVFPEDTDVPLSAVRALWETDDIETERLVERLDNFSLIQYDLRNATIHLHDVLRRYLAAQLPDPAELHARLVLEAWGNLSDVSDAYAWRWAGYHLAHAGRLDQLRALLCSFNYLQAKLEATDVNALIADYDYLPDDRDLQLVQGAIRLSAHVLARDKSQLASQLTGRLLSFDDSLIQSLLSQARRHPSSSLLYPLSPSLTPPGGPLLRILEGHTEGVNSVAITPDGTRAASASVDKTIRVWNLVSGEEIRVLTGHTDGVTSVAIAPDGKRAVSTSGDWTLRVWDLETGNTLRILTGHTDGVTSVAITSDGTRIISTSIDKTLRVWDLETGEALRTLRGHADRANSVAITPDGKCALSASRDRKLREWDLETGETGRIFEGHADGVHGIAITPDGKRVVSPFHGRTLHLWDLDSGRALQVLEGHEKWVDSVSITPDGKRAVSTSGDWTLRVWDLETGKELRILKGHADRVCGVAVSPDGKRAVSASGDRTLRVWDLEGREASKPLENHKNSVHSVAITPDGTWAVSASWDRTLRVWSLASGRAHRILKGHTDTVHVVVVMPDGRRAISASLDKTLRVWDIKSGVAIRVLEGHENWVNSVAITPDGKRAVSASVDKTLRVWDVESGQVLQILEGHAEWVHSVVVTPDGTRAVSASHDRTLCVWDIESGGALQTLEGHKKWVRCVAITPDGKRAVSGSWDKAVRVWDLENAEVPRILGSHADWVHSVAVTPDGKRAVSASEDRTLRVWDIKSGVAIRVLEGHTDRVHRTAITPDGRRTVSVSRDRTLRVWDLESGDEIASFYGDSGLLSCAISPDGKTIVAGEDSGRVHFLRLEGDF